MTPNATSKPVPRPTIITTPEVRLSFPALFKPKPKSQGSAELTYQATLLIPPTCDLKPFITAMQAAIAARWGAKVPPGLRNPIRNAEEKDYAGYEKGWKFISTQNTSPVPVVDRQRIPITDPSKVYAGCWIHACIGAWTYDNVSKGVSFELKAVQFLRDDERLDGRGKPVNPDEAFEAIEMPPEETASGGAIDPAQFFQGMS